MDRRLIADHHQSPSPISEASKRTNPFSIDYILSTTPMTQPRGHPSLQSTIERHQALNMQQPPPFQTPHPNFLHLVASMFLQGQQHMSKLARLSYPPQPDSLTASKIATQNINQPMTNMNTTSSLIKQHQQPQIQRQIQTSSCRSSGFEKLDLTSKPAHSYIGLIGMCILSSPEKRMVLNDIYQFILDNYPYYRNRGSGWRNSVRHNLSLNECFQKAGRAANGKGHYWTIHPANMEDFMLGDFRRRRAQRKVRRWNNMDVPSDESDDESMDDANKPPLPEHFKRSIEMHKRLEMSYHHKAVSANAEASTAAAFMAAAAAAISQASSSSTSSSSLADNPGAGNLTPINLIQKQLQRQNSAVQLVGSSTLNYRSP